MWDKLQSLYHYTLFTIYKLALHSNPIKPADPHLGNRVSWHQAWGVTNTSESEEDCRIDSVFLFHSLSKKPLWLLEFRNTLDYKGILGTAILMVETHQGGIQGGIPPWPHERLA